MESSLKSIYTSKCIFLIVHLEHRTYYSTAPPQMNPSNVNPNWSMGRSPPHQQAQQGQQQAPPQVNDPQRNYPSAGAGQNMVSQAPPQAGGPNAAGMAGRSTSTSGPSGQTGAGGPPSMAHQYQMGGSVPTAYPYGANNQWYASAQQISSPQTSMPPQINAYSMMYEASQQQPMPQAAAYMHPNAFDAAYFQQVQAQQQQAQQAGLDTVPPGSYNR